MNEYLAACLALPKPTASYYHGFPHSSWDTIEHIEWDRTPRVEYREEMVGRYAWAIPDDAAIRALVELSPLVEIGAGRGYWAYLLRQAGADVLAFDTYRKSSRYWRPENGETAWTEVLYGGPERARLYPERTLLLIWPPMSDMAVRALRAYRGARLAYVGESEGCTADDAFRRRLYRDWGHVRDVAIPQWGLVHDRLMIYRRKR